MMTPLRALAAAVFAVVLMSSCVGNDSNDDRTFSESLGWIPSNGDNASEVILLNLQTLRDSAGVELPEDRTNIEQINAYETALLEASRLNDLSLLVLDQEIGDERIQRNYLDYLHLGLADVDLIAEAGLPPNRVFVAGGRFDADAAGDTLLECTGCFEPTDEYDHEGVTYYGWGVEREQHLRERLSPPMYDQLGRGGRLFLTDDIAVKTQSDALMRAVLDTSPLDDRRSLADIEDFQLAAQALDDEDAWYAHLTRTTQGPELWEEIGEFWPDYLDEPGAVERFETQWNPSSDTPVLREHQLFAAGAVSTGDDNYLVLVLVHEDSSSAEASVDLLQRRINELDSALSGEPWSDIITSAEIEADGRILIARLHGLDLWTFAYSADPLTLHE